MSSKLKTADGTVDPSYKAHHQYVNDILDCHQKQEHGESCPVGNIVSPAHSRNVDSSEHGCNGQDEACSAQPVVTHIPHST